jgi:hypothetical protein
MLNLVRISGTIEDEIDLRRHADGTETASVSLRFSQGCGAILLCCFGASTRHLAKFRPGDAVAILGRLRIGRHDGKASVIVDEAHYLNGEDEWRDRDRSATLHRFNAGRQVVGIKNARAGPR